jgi:tetratricopeptide (TPR) repeat protein
MAEPDDDAAACETLDRGLAAAFGPGPSSRGVLATLADSIGPVLGVLLRDTEDGVKDAVVRPSPPGAPDAAGRYQIFGEIARGGMGAVLKGRDADLGRELAVKVLLERHRDNPELVRRFLEEAQIGGQLQHPGIVPVYELGAFADRRPFFTMKLVKGRTLAELLGERKDPVAELPRLLGIFEQISQAVAYAHARGVIHRDLKPSNVMVGSFGEVQVMDWGLAKVLPRGGVVDDAAAGQLGAGETVIATARSGDPTAELSQVGSVLGTPSYMAPEQARGEAGSVDERADVFALGSILCEILTGTPAFTGRSSGEIQRKAARGELAEAFARLDAGEVDAELIGLARGCLAVEPADRPRDAGGVAERVGAYLAGVQRKLRAAEVAEDRARAESEAKRRKTTVALAASLLALVVVGGGGAAWLAQQGVARRARLENLLGEARAALDRVERGNEADAPAEAEKARVALGQAREVAAGGADPAMATRLRALQDREAEAGKLRSLLGTLERIRGELAEHDDFKRSDREYAAAFRAFGLDLDSMDPREAGARLAGRPATVEIAAALDAWSTIRRVQIGRGKDDPSWRRLVGVARAADPDAWRNGLRDLFGRPVAEANMVLKGRAADAEALANQPAASLVLLAAMLRRAGDRDGSAAVLRAAWRRFPGDYWVNSALAVAPGADSGQTWELFPRPDEAVRYLSAALAVHPRSATALRRLGIALSAQGKGDEAIAALREAIRLKPDAANFHIGLSLVLANRGKWDEAASAAREAIRLKPDEAVAHSNLGWDLVEQTRLDEGIAALREAIRLQPDFARARKNLSAALVRQGKNDEAIAEYRELARLQPDDASAHNELAWALATHPDRHRREPEEALAHALRATELAPNDSNFFDTLAAAEFRASHVGESVEASRRSMDLGHRDTSGAIAKARLDDDPARGEGESPFDDLIGRDPDDGLVRILRGVWHVDRRRWAEAEADLSRAIEVYPKDWPLRRERGLLLARLGRPDRAAADFGVAVEQSPDDALLARDWAFLLLASDDREGHRRAAARQMKSFGRTRDPRAAGALVHTWVLSQRAFDDWEGAIRLAELGTKGNPNSPREHGALAGAYLRAGRHRDALRELDESDRLGGAWEARTLNDLMRALVLIRLDRAAEGRALLVKADRWSDKHLKGGPFGEFVGDSWRVWYAFRALKAEAEGLLRDPGFPADPFAR